MTYPQAIVYSLVFGGVVALISWAVRPDGGATPLVVGTVFAGVNLAVRSMRIWDRRSSDQ